MVDHSDTPRLASAARAGGYLLLGLTSSGLVSALLEKTRFEIPVLVAGSAVSLWVAIRIYRREMRKFREREQMLSEHPSKGERLTGGLR